MKDCERVLEDLALLAVEEIEPERRAALLRHLDGCPDCRRERAAFDRTIAELRVGEVPDPGPVYWSGFEGRFRARLQARRVATGRRRVLAVAALVVAAVGLGLLVGRAPAPVGTGDAATERATNTAGSDAGLPVLAEGERAEARLEAALHAVRGRTSGAEEFEAILDEIAPGDPYALTGVEVTEPERNSGV